MLGISLSAFESMISLHTELTTQWWDAQNLEEVCDLYAKEAILINSSGVYKGRDEILRCYQTAFPDKNTMGALSSEVLSLGFDPIDNPQSDLTGMATAIFRWRIAQPNGHVISGHRLTTFVLVSYSEITISQDMSVQYHL